MKKILTVITLILTLCVLFASCSLLGIGNPVDGTVWSGTQDDYIPHETYTVTFSGNKYTVSYHKDAVNTKEVQQEAEDKSLEGTWEYDSTVKYSWTGDWNFTHKTQYIVLKLSSHPFWESGAYFCFEKDSNCAYLCKEFPDKGDYMKGFKLVLGK